MMLLFYLFCIFLKCVYSQPSNGLHGGPIEAECLSFMSRERIWVPVALDEVIGPMGGPSNNPISLARHHIIPVRTLRSFFDTAVRENHEGNVELTGLMSLMGFLSDDALNQYGETDSLNRYIRSDLEQMRQLQSYYINQEFEFNNPPVDILFSADYLVRSVFQWIPANIFIGPAPQLRSDDPGDAFEVNSRYIIGEEAYQRLVTINRMMESYVQTRERATYNEVIELLAEISRGRDVPYPFDRSQWIYENNRYRINTNPHNRKRREAEDVPLIDDDPYCLKPLELIKMSMHEENLIIVSEVLDRAIKHKGFYSKNYGSWKIGTLILPGEFGIYADGISMAGQGWVYDPYGYKFNDNSFAVGILGTDARGKSDNWVNLSHDFTTTEGTRDYAGQVFFDKNGRPVAIVITSRQWADVGSGWSFIYNNEKWEYERTDSWDERRFAGRTESLDTTAPKFVMS
ncbi:Aip56 [Danaus plexippus plexippus]|uniref:Aip56 n=1 Tax=Danaus plexippus plexippus TaxID=278856 RepID=A0A212EU73_DANPL|nr:Aip56 [Danaus plexippus plexippus]